MNKQAYKTFWVRANMGKIKEKVTKKRQVGTNTVTKTKGLFKKETYDVEEPIYEEYSEWVPTGKNSDTFIDIEDFSERIMNACNELHADGYDIINISDIIDGRYKYNTWEGQNTHGTLGSGGTTWGAGWGYGYGYSVTDGVIITAKLKEL